MEFGIPGIGAGFILFTGLLIYCRIGKAFTGSNLVRIGAKDVFVHPGLNRRATQRRIDNAYGHILIKMDLAGKVVSYG